MNKGFSTLLIKSGKVTAAETRGPLSIILPLQAVRVEFPTSWLPYVIRVLIRRGNTPLIMKLIILVLFRLLDQIPKASLFQKNSYISFQYSKVSIKYQGL